MHPYEMQRLIRQRHKDEFLDLKKGSLYHAIERLKKAGLIEEASTGREGRRPERTTYRITETGETELQDWLRSLLAQPAYEASAFIAAMSFVAHLSPEEVIDQLEIRTNQLDCGIVALGAILKNLVPKISRIPLLEAEYMLAMRRAELDWVRSLIAELRAGTLHWNTEHLLNSAKGHPRACPGSAPSPPSDSS
jgi:DNA-binding PadR family transcriptional regulator